MANISANGAQLNGAINPPAAKTTWYFEYGLTSAYATRTTPQTLAGFGARPINARLAGLQPGATFHYRLVAQTSTTQYVGPDNTFKTKNTVRLRPAGLTLTASALVRPRSVALTVYGALRPPPGTFTGTACSGVVEVQIMRGIDTISLRDAALLPNCTYRQSVALSASRLGRAKSVAVRVRFTGNATTLPSGVRGVFVGV